MAYLRNNISAVMMVCNEEYWIDYAIKPLVNAGIEVFIGDCGSTDATLEILKIWKDCPLVHVTNYGKLSPDDNGKVRELLSHQADTQWILIVDGDEIITKEGMPIILDIDMDGWRGAFITKQILVWRNNNFRIVKESSQRRICRRDNEWIHPYPFENMTDAEEYRKEFCYPTGVTGYHMKFLERSSRDKDTYLRTEKNTRYWDYLEAIEGEPHDLFSVLGPPRFPNPYWNRT